MEQNENKRLDELFNQAKNEPSKVSFKETEAKFLKSSASFSKGAKGGKLAQFSNLKTIIMISTISAVTIGATVLIYNFSAPTGAEKQEYLTDNAMDDSTLIMEEHETVVNTYLKRVEMVKADFPLALLVPSELVVNSKHAGVELVDTLKKKPSTDNNAINHIVDTSYRFPKLTYEEVKANGKRKKKMIKLLSKRMAYGYLRIPGGEMTVNKKAVKVETFDMKQTEVTNLQYKTFLFDLLIQGREDDFLIAKPDQQMWVKEYKYSFNQPMVDHYFSHAAYNEYPVVAVSRRGAEMFCEWLSSEINKTNAKKLNGLVCKMRIPTSTEWMYAASGGGTHFPYPWGGPYLRNAKGSFLANFKPMKDNYKIDGAFHTAKVSSYPPNKFELYCMSGNVAEMVDYVEENNLPGTKGGSWTSVGQELQIVDGKDRFKGKTTPSVNVGFRPVITYVKNGGGAVSYKPDITVTPPGTVKFGPGLFFDKTEITNFNWQEYVMWQVKTYGKRSQEHINALPDTLVWKSKLAYNEPYVTYYFNHPAYNNYPVVGISYEQAVDFCKWRTDRVKELYEIQQLKNKKAIYPVNFEYRLPSKLEWERMANVGYSEKMMKKIIGKYKGKSLANFRKGKGDNMGVAGDLNDNADVTAPVESYWPNALGCYNLIGNVAEMTNVKGIAKGGAWNHEEDDIAIEKDFNYAKQSAWLGFRCVFEVME